MVELNGFACNEQVDFDSIIGCVSINEKIEALIEQIDQNLLVFDPQMTNNYGKYEDQN